MLRSRSGTSSCSASASTSSGDGLDLAGLDEAEVPRRYPDVEGEVELAAAAVLPPLLEERADGGWAERRPRRLQHSPTGTRSLVRWTSDDFLGAEADDAVQFAVGVELHHVDAGDHRRLARETRAPS